MQYFFGNFLKLFSAGEIKKVDIIYAMGKMTEISELDALPDGKMRAVFPRGLPVLLARKGAEVFALENRCAHMGCPLAGGKLDGYTLQCPCHDWKFDIRDGKFLDAPELSLKTYAVKTMTGKIFLEV